MTKLEQLHARRAALKDAMEKLYKAETDKLWEQIVAEEKRLIREALWTYAPQGQMALCEKTGVTPERFEKLIGGIDGVRGGKRNGVYCYWLVDAKAKSEAS